MNVGPPSAGVPDQRLGSLLVRGNVPWLLTIRAAYSVSLALLVVDVPLYLRAAGYSTARIGVLLSLASLGSFVLILGTSFFADRVGRKRVLIAVALLAVAGAALDATTTGFWLLAIAGALTSLARGGGGAAEAGLLHPAEQPLLAASVTDRQRNPAFAALAIAGAFGGLLGSLLAGLPDVLQARGHVTVLGAYHISFAIAAVITALLLPLIAPVREPRPARPAAAPIISRRNVGIVLRLWLIDSLQGLAGGLLGPFLSLWLAERFGAGPGRIGGLNAMISLATMAVYLGSPVVARRVGSVRAVVLLRLAGVAGLAALALAPTFRLASLANILRILAMAMSGPVQQSFIMGVSDEASRSRLLGVASIPGQLVLTASPGLGGTLMRSVSVTAPIWLATGAFGLGAILYGALFRRLVPPEEQPGRRQAAGRAAYTSGNIPRHDDIQGPADGTR